MLRERDLPTQVGREHLKRKLNLDVLMMGGILVYFEVVPQKVHMVVPHDSRVTS